MTPPPPRLLSRPVRRVGFTGSTGGMTAPQREEVARLLASARKRGATEFVFGLCVGADEEAGKLARELGYQLVGRPGRPLGDRLRSRLKVDVLYEIEAGATPELSRNSKIAEEGNEFIAAPAHADEVLRSGTWATVRRIRRLSKPLSVVSPTGELLV